MNTDKYIEQYLDEILENTNFLLENDINTVNSLNEDDCQDDITSELYQSMYENKFNSDKSKQKVNFNLDNNNIFEFDNIDDNDKNNLIDLDIELGYYLNLINIFMLYYNEKFEKSENFFSGVHNVDMDTSNQMELFFEAIVEYSTIKKNLDLNDSKMMEQIFSKEKTKEILNLFENSSNQIYSLEFGFNDNKLISSSLLVCLNYIYENKLIDSDWNIYNLRNIC